MQAHSILLCSKPKRIMARILPKPLTVLLWLVALGNFVGILGHKTSTESQPKHDHDQSTIHLASRKLSTPTHGDYRALIVLMRFTDHTNRDLPPSSYFQTVCDGDPASDPSVNSIMSMAKFFEIQSQHQYKISWYVS